MLLRDKSFLKAIWAGMFILCGVLGFLPDTQGGAEVLMITLAVLFFAAPGYLVWLSWKQGDRANLRLVRNISALSLGSQPQASGIVHRTWTGDSFHI